MFDLNGYNQTVGSLTNPVDLVTNVSATNNGYITNSSYGVRTLTAGERLELDLSRGDPAQRRVGQGRGGNLRLMNDNTYLAPRPPPEAFSRLPAASAGRAP